MENFYFLDSFDKSYRKLSNNNEEIKRRVKKTLFLLKGNHHHPSLKSHKVNTKKYGIRFSSRVTGDIRIIWDFDKGKLKIIQIFDISKHSGRYKTYK